MRRQFNNVISVVHSAIRFGTLKLLNGKNIKVKCFERFSPDVVFEMNKGAKVKLGRMIRAHSGCKFKIRRNAELTIEDGVKINYYCIFACHERITIGSGTEFGPSVYLYDHDHDYSVGLTKDKFITAPIKIGKNCWIGANTIILRGTQIGDNCVIGAGSVVHGDIPPNTVYIQKRSSTIRNYEGSQGE